jgi:hypothetical protein
VDAIKPLKALRMFAAQKLDARGLAVCRHHVAEDLKVKVGDLLE